MQNMSHYFEYLVEWATDDASNEKRVRSVLKDIYTVMTKSTRIENAFRQQDEYNDRGKYIFAFLNEIFEMTHKDNQKEKITDEKVFALIRENFGQKYSLLNEEDVKQNIKRKIDAAANKNNENEHNTTRKSRRNINDDLMKEQLKNIAKDFAQNKIQSIKYCDVGAGDCVRSFVFANQIDNNGLWVDNLTMFDFVSWNQYDDNIRNYALNLMKAHKKINHVEFLEIENGVDYDGVPNSFEIMSLFYVTHHMDNAALRFFIRQARRLISKNGYLILKDHNLDDDVNIALCQVQHLAYRYLNDEMQSDDKIYARSSKKITKMLLDGGFELVSMYKEPDGVNSIVHIYTKIQ